MRTRFPADIGDGRYPWLGQIGRLGLYALLVFFQLNATVAYIGLALTLAAFILQWRLWYPLLRHDKIVFAYLALVVYILAYSFWAAHEFPDTAPAQSTAAWNWMHWLAFIPVAWQLHMNRQETGRLLLALAAGVLTRILLHVEWGDLAHIQGWQRTGFGIVETVFSPIAGMVALGFAMLAPRMIAWESGDKAWPRILRVVLCSSGLLILLEALILAQTRGVWLSLAICLPLALAVRYWTWLKYHAFKTVQGLAILAVILLAATLFVQKNSASIINRFTAERINAEPETVNKVIANQQVAMTSSIGYRILLWRLGVKRWAERPWFGWGPGSTEFLLKQSHDVRLTQEVTLADGTVLSMHLPHLHNLYLEILLRFGLFGAALFGSIPVLLLAGVRKSYGLGIIPWDYACFIVAGWACIGMMACFDFQIFKFAWRNASLIWAALSYAVCLECLADTSPKSDLPLGEGA